MIRVVIAGDDDGDAAELAMALRDAGIEVVYTGPLRTAEQVAATVVQEDADAVGFRGTDEAAVAELRGLLVERGAEDVVVFPSTAAPDEIVQSLTGTDTRRSESTRTT
ncbi:cobalamin B12-binding domain-containing protein [Allokutzneria oryzae]|uniref:Cobalamin B12-binding domain-containing protein n=1 Tax=Allokutzneria oryzae TaxID=1378989 RepID=A0ABV6A230_9PSEU